MFLCKNCKNCPCRGSEEGKPSELKCWAGVTATAATLTTHTPYSQSLGIIEKLFNTLQLQRKVFLSVF